MAVASDSYGSAAGVGAQVPMHANESVTFDVATNPTLAVVESWIDQLSDAVNLELDNYGYSVPATGRLASWLTAWVNTEVAAQVRAVKQRTQRGPTDGENQNEGPRALLTNINQVVERLESLSRGNRFSAGSKALTRKDAWSDEYDTTESD